MIAAGAIGGSVTVFDAEDGKIRHVVSAHSFGLTTLAWRAGTSEFATGGRDGSIRLWNAVTGSELGRLEAGDSWVERVAWRAHGNRLATAAGKITSSVGQSRAALTFAFGPPEHNRRH